MFQFFYFKFIYINLYIILKSKETNINATAITESSIIMKSNIKENITNNMIEKRNFNFLNLSSYKSYFQKININEILIFQ